MVGAFSKIEYSDIFLIKIWIKAHPLLFIFTIFLLGMSIFAYIVYLNERKDDDDLCSDPVNCKLNFYYNNVWAIIISMFTIGYGDAVPITVGGRLITIFAVIVGVFCVATFNGVVQDYLSLSNEELMTVRFIEVDRKYSKFQKSALKCIYCFFRFYVHKYKNTEHFQKGNAYKKLEHQVNEFRKYRMLFK